MINLNKALSGIKLYTETKDNKLLTLTFGVYKGYFRLYINKMDKDFKNNEFIFTAMLTTVNTRLVYNKLKNLHKLKDKYAYEVKMFGAKFVDDKRVMDERSITGSFKIMKVKNKDDDLVNVIQIIDKLDKKYNFVLMNTPYVDIYINNVKVTDKSILSNEWCEAYSVALGDVLRLMPEGLEKEKVNTPY